MATRLPGYNIGMMFVVIAAMIILIYIVGQFF